MIHTCTGWARALGGGRDRGIGSPGLYLDVGVEGLLGGGRIAENM